MRFIFIIPFIFLVFSVTILGEANSSPFDQQFRPNSIDLESECARMYSLREDGTHYPEDTQKVTNHCQVKAKGEKYNVSSKQYYKYIHKTLRFVCKGKRPILLDLMSSISGCDGQTRHLSIRREGKDCYLYTEETQGKYLIPRRNIIELKNRMATLDFFDQIAFELAGNLVKVAIDEVINC